MVPLSLGCRRWVVVVIVLEGGVVVVIGVIVKSPAHPNPPFNIKYGQHGIYRLLLIDTSFLFWRKYCTLQQIGQA
jgi:hypothetical protein